jgi:hypothetical protein
MSLTNLNLPVEQPKTGAFGAPIAARPRRPGRDAALPGPGLWQRVAQECEAMAEDLLCAGRVIPEEVVVMLAEALPLLADPAARAAEEHGGADDECWAPRPEAATRAVDKAAIANLAKVHAALAALSAPSTPEAVLLLSEERRRNSRFYVFGPLPIVRQMLALTLISLIAFIAVSLSPDINSDNMRKSFLDLTGAPLLITEIFLLSAASLGSCFQNLQQMNGFISAGSYDPRFQSSYWTRWMMGIISGFLLAELLHDLLFVPGSPVGSMMGGASGTLTGAVPGADGAAASAGRGTPVSAIVTPMLALLGGYSVDLVHGILSQIVKALAGFFRTPSVGQGEDRGAAQPPGPRGG